MVVFEHPEYDSFLARPRRPKIEERRAFVRIWVDLAMEVCFPVNANTLDRLLIFVLPRKAVEDLLLNLLIFGSPGGN